MRGWSILTSEKEIYDYWQGRAKNLVYYRGEAFYTVTSLPFYIKRREEMLYLLNQEMQSILSDRIEPINILDFGCGDGKYSILIKQLYPQCEMFGCDLSPNMISQAKQNASRKNVCIKFKISDSHVPFKYLFDVILINAVFAHININLLDSIVENLTNHLSENGRIIVFEQTALYPQHGQTWNRHTEDFYEKLFNSYGFVLNWKQLISHRRYDKYENMLHKYLFRHRKNPNKSKLYLFLCEILMKLTEVDDEIQIDADEGNTFFVFYKI